MFVESMKEGTCKLGSTPWRKEVYLIYFFFFLHRNSKGLLLGAPFSTGQQICGWVSNWKPVNLLIFPYINPSVSNKEMIYNF